MTNDKGTKTVQLDGSASEFETPKGETKSATFSWDGDKIVGKIDGGMQVERYMDGDKMVVAITSAKGSQMLRIHTKA